YLLPAGERDGAARGPTRRGRGAFDATALPRTALRCAPWLRTGLRGGAYLARAVRGAARAAALHGAFVAVARAVVTGLPVSGLAGVAAAVAAGVEGVLRVRDDGDGHVAAVVVRVEEAAVADAAGRGAAQVERERVVLPAPRAVEVAA